VAPRVLIVEDEPAIAESVSYALRRDGFESETAGGVEEAEQRLGLAEPRFDLVVLDLMLPDGSGFDLLGRLRRRGDLPAVIVLSSRDDEADRVSALETGADDYVTKPFSPREVVARVRAVLRRARGATEPTRGGVEAVSLDVERRRVTVLGQHVELTRVEFDVLAHLLAAEGCVLSRGQLIDRVWGDGYALSDRTVDSHVKSLRKKLADAGGDPAWIETVRGVGYRMTASASPADPPVAP
jgi:two-component system catabolic regulation response regulator CreB